MLLNVKTVPTELVLKNAFLAAAATVFLLSASTAMAGNKSQSITKSVASGARACVTSGACAATPTGRAFGGAVRSMDRLGWEIGRSVSIKKLGPAGDPGRYPGIER